MILFDNSGEVYNAFKVALFLFQLLGNGSQTFIRLLAFVGKLCGKTRVLIIRNLRQRIILIELFRDEFKICLTDDIIISYVFKQNPLLSWQTKEVSFVAEDEEFDLHRHPGTDADYGVAASWMAASNSPPDCCF